MRQLPALRRDDRDLGSGDVRLAYTNSYVFEHVRWSEERVYMALLMGAAMGIVMLGFMWRVHENATVNIGIIAGAVVLALVALYRSRSQRSAVKSMYERTLTD